MRGRRPSSILFLSRPGNTPAYAGKTGCLLSLFTPLRKHPRVCGEDKTKKAFLLPRQETPPRMRGRLLRRLVMRRVGRNTPAYAGKTTMANSPVLWRWKHPRVCGEDRRRPQDPHPHRETPPRMRGRLEQHLKAVIEDRNTPAYAGKTQTPALSNGHSEKHPRVCGEDFQALTPNSRTKETPPRMRGRPFSDSQISIM